MEAITHLSPWVQTTSRCNLKCPYCFVRQKNFDMPAEIYSFMNSYLLGLVENGKINHAELRLAGGEPLLVFDKWSALVGKFLKAGGKKVKAEVLTNLAMMPDDFLDYLNIHENFGVSVSLDSVRYSKPFKNKMSSSRQVMRNIEKLKEKRKVFIMTVLTDGGRHLPELAKYVLDNGFNWELQLNKFYEKDFEKEESVANLRKMVEEFSRRKLSVHRNLKFNFCSFKSSKGCEAGRELFYINQKGDIYNCQMQEFGKPLTNISNGDLLEKLKQNNVQRPYAAGCKGCSLEEFCRGDCPINNTPERKKYFCDIMKEYFSCAAKNVMEFGRV